MLTSPPAPLELLPLLVEPCGSGPPQPAATARTANRGVTARARRKVFMAACGRQGITPPLGWACLLRAVKLDRARLRPGALVAALLLALQALLIGLVGDAAARVDDLLLVTAQLRVIGGDAGAAPERRDRRDHHP